jgi:DNA-binding NarL/FixJ family response regulator
MAMVDAGFIRIQSSVRGDVLARGRRAESTPALASQELLVTLAAAAAGGADWEVSLTSIWHDLLAGRRKLVVSFANDQSCCLVVSPESAELPARPLLDSRELRILDRVLLGVPQKIIAIEGDIAASTVAAAVRHCMERLGMACPSGRIPALIMLMALAGALENQVLSARMSIFSYQERSYAVLSVPRPHPALLRELSRTEQALVALLLERRSNSEIACIRGTSQRTVANQIGSVLHKLKVAGRNGIVVLLLRRWFESRTGTSEPASSTRAWGDGAESCRCGGAARLTPQLDCGDGTRGVIGSVV